MSPLGPALANARTSTRIDLEADSVFGLVDSAAEQHPDQTAVIDERGETTYRGLAEQSRRMAAVFASHGVGARTRVALWLPNSSFWLAAHLGLARLGAIAVGVNARYPAAEVLRIVRAADVSALIVDPASGGAADQATLEEVVARSEGAVRTVFTRSTALDVPDVECVGTGAVDAPERPVCSTVDPNAGFAVFASSGSTADPKLILHSQRAIVEHSRAVAASFGYHRPGTVVLAQLPMCGVWGFNTVYAALAAGKTVASMERFRADDAVVLIDRARVTTANGPDVFVRRLFGAADEACSPVATLRDIGFSTFSNDSRKLVDLADTHGVRLFQVYGSSEQQALMLHQSADADAATRSDPGGLPSNPGTTVRVREPETGHLVGIGVPGQLETSGPNVMLGYLVPDGVDRSAFTDDDWLRTGDIVELTDAGGVRYLNREKDSLRLSGFLVDPQEIEVQLEADPQVIEAKVVGVETSGGPTCVAFVRLTDPHDFDPEQTRTRCAAQLAAYKVPTAIYPIDDFPRVDGANGQRIQRRALRELATTMGGQR